MKITMFVANAASTASQPGVPSNTLRLNLPPKGDKVDDANVDVFPDQAKKNGQFEAGGISDEAIKEFVGKGGKRVTVTIELAE